MLGATGSEQWNLTHTRRPPARHRRHQLAPAAAARSCPQASGRKWPVRTNRERRFFSCISARKRKTTPAAPIQCHQLANTNAELSRRPSLSATAANEKKKQLKDSYICVPNGIQMLPPRPTPVVDADSPMVLCLNQSSGYRPRKARLGEPSG